MTPPSVPPEMSGPAAKPPAVWLLALITFSGTLAMHMFVPAMPLAAAELRSSPTTIQATLGVYIVGLAFGQLFYGPLSDRLGRRPVLLAGLALYTVAGVAAALAPSASFLIGARLFQALGGCAGLVLARAIVRDTSTTADSASRLALMNMFVTLAPGIAPLAGGLIASLLGWRAVLAALTLLGIANALLTWLMLAETAPQHSHASVLRDYTRLFGSPRFLGFAVGGACATTATFGFIAAAPFIFTTELGRPPHEIGIYLAILFSGVWFGSFLARRIIPRFPIGTLLIRANLASLAVAILLLGAILSGSLSVPLIVGAMFLYTLGIGIAAPTSLAQAISVDRRMTGSASGLYGFFQMAVGAVCTALVGIGPDPALSAVLVLVGAGVVGQTCFWVARRSPA